MRSVSWISAGFALVSMLSQPASACTCEGQTVSQARRAADVIFAGRVEEVTVVDDPEGHEPRIIVRFNVGKTWKGPVTRSFTMHSNVEFSSCSGFFSEFLETGTTLMVYGQALPARAWKGSELAGAPNANSFTVMGDERKPLPPEIAASIPDDSTVYTTHICTRTMPVIYAVEDFRKLGKGRDLGTLEQLPDAGYVKKQREADRYISNKLPDDCAHLTDARVWNVLEKPPEDHEAIIARVENEYYRRSIPMPPPTRYRNYWVRSRDGMLGLCRESVDPKIECGEVRIEFGPGKHEDGRLHMNGDVDIHCKNPDGSPWERPESR